MDFFPDYGEPGPWDELFHFGPAVFLVSLGLFLFFLAKRNYPQTGWVHWVAVAIGGSIATIVVLILLLAAVAPFLAID